MSTHLDLRTLRADSILLLTAAIWGFAFAAQRAGMEYVGPFLYNGIRFFLGALVLLPLWIRESSRRRQEGAVPVEPVGYAASVRAGQPRFLARMAALPPVRLQVLGGIAAGSVLFLGVSFQQVGILYSTAGKAGFITGLYVVIVPILGSLWGRHSRAGTWLGAALCIVGLYLLSVSGRLTIQKGDLLVVVSAFFWAIHVHLLAWLSPRVSSVKLATIQYVVCACLSMIVSAASEPIVVAQIWNAGIAIAYGGVCSVGIAYTLQVVAQRKADPAHAAIVLSLEGVFAVLGGYLVLSETLSARSLFGCGLMLGGMLVSQLANVVRSRRSSPQAARRGANENSR